MQNLLELWTNLSNRRRAIVIGATVGMFLAVLGLARMAGTPNMALLYSGLESAAAGDVIAALDAQNAKYEVRGDAIYVDDAQRDNLRNSSRIDPLQPIEQPGMGNQQCGVRIGQHMLEDRAAIGRVERHEDGTEIVDCIECDQRLAPVLRLADDRHGEMAWLERNADKRVEPEKILAQVKSVITLAVSYVQGPRSEVQGGASRDTALALAWPIESSVALGCDWK